MKRLLFICSRNQLRSPTAEAIFSERAEVDSAGLDNHAVVPLSPEQVAWADFIFVMDSTHAAKLRRKFRRELNGQRVIVLGIPDDYRYMDPALVELLERKVAGHL